MKYVKPQKQITVAKLPIFELVIRLTEYFNIQEIRDIVSQSTGTGYIRDGVAIIYDSDENIFVVISQNPEMSSLTKIYTGGNMLNKFKQNESQYRFLDGSRFTQEELAYINNCKRDNSQEAQFICKLVRELQKRALLGVH